MQDSNRVLRVISELAYPDGSKDTTVRGDSYGGALYKLDLKDTEYITKVVVGMRWNCLNYLKFTTNEDRTLVSGSGSDSVTRYGYTPPIFANEGQRWGLVGFYGRVARQGDDYKSHVSCILPIWGAVY